MQSRDAGALVSLTVLEVWNLKFEPSAFLSLSLCQAHTG